MKNLISFILLFTLAITAHAAKIGDDKLIVGKPGSAADKEINLGSEVIIRNNKTSGKAEFSEDGGTNFKRFGTGSGGGGGENFNNGFGTDDNANAESGTDSWTNSGGGSFAVTTTDPLEGDASFTFTASAQNDYVESTVLSFDKDIFKGQSCEARIEYIGGDENLSLQVVNGNNVVIVEESIPAHGIFGPESVFFLCPSQADITGDAQLGNLRYRVANTGASAAPLIKWDKSYIGTLRGLTGTSSEIYTDRHLTGGSTSSAGVITNLVVEDEEPNFSRFFDVASGVYTAKKKVKVVATAYAQINQADARITVAKNGFLVGQSSHDNAAGYSAQAAATFMLDAGETFDFRVVAGSATNGIVATITATSIEETKVYKVVPTTKDTENVSEMIVDATGAVFDQTVGFVSGNCTNPSTGRWLCDVTPMNNTVNPTCQVTQRFGSGGSTIFSCKMNSLTELEIGAQAASGPTPINQPFNLSIKRAGVDFRKTQTRSIALGGIVVNSSAEINQKQVRSESCTINVAGTAVPDSASGLCDTWVGSANRFSAGQTAITFVSGTFSKQPNCHVTLKEGGNNRDYDVEYNNGSLGLQVNTRASGASADLNFTISCEGVK